MYWYVFLTQKSVLRIQTFKISFGYIRYCIHKTLSKRGSFLSKQKILIKSLFKVFIKQKYKITWKRYWIFFFITKTDCTVHPFSVFKNNNFKGKILNFNIRNCGTWTHHLLRPKQTYYHCTKFRFFKEKQIRTVNFSFEDQNFTIKLSLYHLKCI